jgi:hypothetical protein
MDGFKIRAKLALSFPRAVAAAEAEEIMMQYARAFATAVECELSNGDVPFEEHELYQRITDQVQVLPKKNVRLIGLHVWQKGAVSSRSMLAVKGGPESSPTVPAMPAVSQTRERAMSPPGAHTATTLKPPEGVGLPASAAPQRPHSAQPSASSASSANMAATRPPAAAAPKQPRASAYSVTQPEAASEPASRVTSPARPAVSTTRAALGTPAAPTPPAARPVTPPPRSAVAPMTSGSFPAAARMASGVVSAGEPRITRSKSGFALALEHCAGDAGADVGGALGQPVRDAAADVLFATLGALHGSIVDPLSLFDGRADENLRGNLVGEACVYVCYVLYDALSRTSLSQMQAIQVVQTACVHALMDQSMPVSELSRYLATESPREEFSNRLCAILQVRETPEMQQRVEAHLRTLRLDVRSCTEQIEQRLARAKALSEQKTG